jgi:sulfoxide reductase heme-binding subunit YedZ
MSTGHHLFWITSRAAGSAALVTASASVAIGILLGRRRGGTTPLSELRPVHEALSLATLALIALHGAALLGDSYLRPGLAGIAIPLAGAYRPAWTALGIVAGYGLAALGVSYYTRSSIGAQRWRRLHRFTALFWVLGVVHTFGSGTDAMQPWFLIMAAAAVLPAACLVAGRTVRGLGAALDLPRSESPVRAGAGGNGRRPLGESSPAA